MLRLLAGVTAILFTFAAVDSPLDVDAFIKSAARQLPGLAAVVARSDGPPRV